MTIFLVQDETTARRTLDAQGVKHEQIEYTLWNVIKLLFRAIKNG